MKKILGDYLYVQIMFKVNNPRVTMLITNI